MKEAILLNEKNWNDVFHGRHLFPFRASQIRHVEKEVSLSTVSFKYNVKGKEVYSNGRRREILHGGDYMLITNQHKCDVYINEDQDDLGVCVDVNEELLKQAISVCFNPSVLEESNSMEYLWFQSEEFTRYRSSEPFKQFMSGLFPVIQSRSYTSLPSLEFEFITRLLQEQLPFFRAYQCVPLMKPQNKRELFQRLLFARNKMQDHVGSSLCISELARELYLSEFRFYHLYKEVFGVSPYKDMLRFKCEEAIRLYHQGNLSWTEIAYELDFADLPTFSKAFKRMMGVAPSIFKRV